LEILLAKRFAESHLRKVGLLLLHLQQALFNRILDNEFDGHYRINLSQAMLFVRPQIMHYGFMNEGLTIRSIAWFSTAGFQ
jgi:hypothetical protein